MSNLPDKEDYVTTDRSYKAEGKEGEAVGRVEDWRVLMGGGETRPKAEPGRCIS